MPAYKKESEVITMAGKGGTAKRGPRGRTSKGVHPWRKIQTGKPKGKKGK